MKLYHGTNANPDTVFDQGLIPSTGKLSCKLQSCGQVIQQAAEELAKIETRAEYIELKEELKRKEQEFFYINMLLLLSAQKYAAKFHDSEDQLLFTQQGVRLKQAPDTSSGYYIYEVDLSYLNRNKLFFFSSGYRGICFDYVEAGHYMPVRKKFADEDEEFRQAKRLANLYWKTAFKYTANAVDSWWEYRRRRVNGKLLGAPQVVPPDWYFRGSGKAEIIYFGVIPPEALTLVANPDSLLPGSAGQNSLQRKWMMTDD